MTSNPQPKVGSSSCRQQQQQQQQRLEAVEQANNTKLNPPAFLHAMWEYAAEWHLLPADQHYNVFGFNLFAPDEVACTTTMVFGDDELQREAAATILVAQPGWLVCFAFTEFDYLSVNMDPADTEHYGSVRLYVNNCNEEYPCAPSVSRLMEHVLAFIQEAKACRQSSSSSSWQENAFEQHYNDIDPTYAYALRRIRSEIAAALLEEDQEGNDHGNPH